MNFLAQAPVANPQGIIDAGNATGRFRIITGAPPSAAFNNAISLIISFMTVTAGLYFLFQIFIAATLWLNAGENEKNAAGARQRIMNALIGLTVTVAGYGIVALFGSLLQIPIFNPLSLFT